MEYRVTMGYLGAHCRLWEEGRSGGLPRGGDAYSKAGRNGLARMTKLGSPDPGREGVEGAKAQDQADFV